MQLTTFKSKGFKSFSELVSFKFDDSLTGVVGPNGCGKSNIVDAIRWVLGESTASSLRGSLLVDVLFNGTEKHSAADWCFVELHFDNNQQMGGAMWSAYPTIIVRRELARDGNQKYTINGQTVRRRDVIDLFHDAGTTPRSYSIIEQGMVGDLAEASPEKLRSYLETAAGVSYYKDRRRNAQLRFRASEENLSNIDLVLEGFAKQIRSLQRQTQTVRSYQRLTNEIKTLEATSLLMQKDYMTAQLEQCHQSIGVHQTNVDNSINKTQVVKEKLNALNAQSQSHNEQLEADRKGMNDAQNAYSLAQYELQNIEKIWQLHQENLIILQKDKVDIANKLQNCVVEKEELQEKINKLEKNVNNQENYNIKQTEDLLLLQKEVQEKQLNFDHCLQQKNELQRLTESESVKEQLLNQQANKLERQIEQIIADIQSKSQLIENVNSETAAYFGDLPETIETLINTIETSEKERDSVEVSKSKTDLEVRELEKELAGLDTEIVALKKLVRQSYDSADELTPIINAYKVKAGKWGGALDAALGVYATAFAVDNIDGFIAQKGMPPVGYAIVESNTNTMFDNTKNTAISLPSLTDSIYIDEAHGQLLKQWISQVYVADTVEQAITQRHQLQDNERIITQDGTVVSKNAIAVYGEVSGGYNWQERFETLIEQYKTQDQIYTQKQNELKQISDKFAFINTTIKAAQQEKQQKQNTLTEKTIAWNREQERQKAIKEQTTQLKESLTTLTNEQTTLHRSQSEIKNKNTAYKVRYAEIQSVFEQERIALQESRTGLEQRQKNFAASTEEHRRLNTEQTQITQRQSHLRDLTVDYIERQQKLQNEISDIEQKIKMTDSSTLQDKFKQQNIVFEQKKQRFNTTNQKITQMLENQKQLNKQREALLVEENNFREQMNEKRIKEREITVNIERLQDFLEELTLDKEVYDALMVSIKEQNTDSQTIKNNIATIKEKRDKLGPINFAAENELIEIQEKKSELDLQKTDATTALDELKMAIARIDNETKSRLKTIFDGINKNFPAIFKKFFGGGDAYLEISDGSILDANFEIKVRIPGKRQLSARMLSGGEKAASALAFIFSIIKLNPPPFCILDEVDAPLDDFRSQLFAQLLKEVAQDVQCIVVSHNKSTISTLPRLIGVTQQEAGVSKIVSVSLGEALRVVTN